MSQFLSQTRWATATSNAHPEPVEAMVVYRRLNDGWIHMEVVDSEGHGLGVDPVYLTDTEYRDRDASQLDPTYTAKVALERMGFTLA